MACRCCGAPLNDADWFEMDHGLCEGCYEEQFDDLEDDLDGDPRL